MSFRFGSDWQLVSSDEGDAMFEFNCFSVWYHVLETQSCRLDLVHSSSCYFSSDGWVGKHQSTHRDTRTYPSHLSSLLIHVLLICF